MKHILIILTSILFLSFDSHQYDKGKIFGKWQIAQIEEDNKIYNNFNECFKKATLEFRDSTCIKTDYSYLGEKCSKQRYSGKVNFNNYRIYIGNNIDKDWGLIEISVYNERFKVLDVNDSILKISDYNREYIKIYKRIK